MKPILGVVLILLGVLALAYQRITFTSRETVLDVGPIEATAERQKTIPLPPMLGGGSGCRRCDRARCRQLQASLSRQRGICSVERRE